MVTARLYKQSGFNLLNIPDSEATLEASAGHIDVPAMDILQVMHNTHITIRAKESQVADADFMKLIKVDDTSAHPTMTAFYAINSYAMTSGDVVDLNVAMEPILTAGGFDNFADYIEGTVTRHHLHKMTTSAGTLDRDQKIYDYMEQSTNESDPYLIPSYTSKLKFRQLVFQAQDIENPGSSVISAKFPYALIVFSSLPTDVARNFKYDIGDPTSGDGLTAEISNYDGDITMVEMAIANIYNDVVYETWDAQSSYFNTPSTYVNYMEVITSVRELKTFKKKLSELAANNLTGIVTQCYYVPMKWFGSGAIKNNTWQSVVANFNERELISAHMQVDSIPVILDNAYPHDHIHNGDVRRTVIAAVESGKCSMQPLMGDNFQISVISSKTGDTKTFKPEEVIQSDGTMTFKGVADPRPHGGIKFAVRRYGGNDEGNNNYYTDIIEGGGWTTESIDSIGRTGYNVNRQLFNAQQSSKDTLADYASMAGLQSYKNTADPISWATKMIGSALEQSALGNLINGGTKDKYSSGFSAEISGFDGIDYTEGILAGNERLIGLANREVEKKAELAQFGAANAPQPIAVGHPASEDLDIMSYSLIVMQRVPDERDINKFIKIQSRFGVRHTTLFDKDFLDNHKNFNYIEMTGANVYQIGSSAATNILNSKMLRQAVADALNTGIRIWHVKPNTSDTNPYKEGN